MGEMGDAGRGPNARGVADFTNALYLGMRHPACALRDWDALTLGKPASLREPPGALALARELAALQGCEAALLLPSTLHLFWDLFGMLASDPLALLVDACAYPVARWGAERAAALGMPVQMFRCGDARQARELARRWLTAGRRPVILADGYCPGAAHLPPLAQYAAIAAEGRGWLLLDDTQVLGLARANGGGSVSWHRLQGAPLLVGASLAKGFGAPLAVLAGSFAMVERFAAQSQTRMHTSPPSAAAIAAGRRALRLNRACGAALRQLLGQRVRQMHKGLAAAGLVSCGGNFPVQTLRLPAAADALALHAALRRSGVEAVLQGEGKLATLSFLLRADHSFDDIGRAVAALEHHLGEVL